VVSNRTDEQLQVTQAHLWAEGIELELRNGELRAFAWDDPTLEIEVFERARGPGREPERLMRWRADRRVPAFPITGEGLQAITGAAIANRLRVKEVRWGRQGRETRATEILAGSPSEGESSPATTF
jgi:hypothetical protein